MFTRSLAPLVLESLADSPVVFLGGARQTGKSTLVRSLAERAHPARYLTLDDLGVLASAKGDPQGFVDGLEGPVILDEIQRAPELFLPLKAAVDRDRRPGRFLLTGSASATVLPELARALAGRVELLTLWPLSQGELEGARESFVDALFAAARPPARFAPLERGDLRERVLRGGYPEPQARPRAERRRAWVESYIATIVERDIRDIAEVDGLVQLPRLLSLLASRTASLLNYAELSRAMGLPQTTLKRYLALLEATFLVRRLPSWSANLGKRLVKAPKLFFNDAGLAAGLLAADAARLDSDGALRGALLETFVLGELTRQASWSQTRPRLHHFRTDAGAEVDFVLEDASGRCAGVEVKAAASVSPADFKGLRFLAQALGGRFARGVVLYAGREVVPFGPELHAYPIEALWRSGAGTAA